MDRTQEQASDTGSKGRKKPKLKDEQISQVRERKTARSKVTMMTAGTLKKLKSRSRVSSSSPCSQTNDQSIERSIEQSTKSKPNESTNQPTNQSINQSIQKKKRYTWSTYRKPQLNTKTPPVSLFKQNDTCT
jgi:hypothetical protein